MYFWGELRIFSEFCSVKIAHVTCFREMIIYMKFYYLVINFIVYIYLYTRLIFLQMIEYLLFQRLRVSFISMIYLKS